MRGLSPVCNLPAAEITAPVGDSLQSPRPFVKWAGGKTQLLPSLLRLLAPVEFSQYLEPFAGSGALFFSLCPQRAYLSDTNPQLMNCYQVVKSNVEALIQQLEKHVYEKDYYYQIRSADREELFADWSAVEQASRFIYLNKTCYNGLYRVNSKGQFNVPFGLHKNPTIADADNLRACSQALKNTRLVEAGFEEVSYEAKRGDFVYFDPPYVPLSSTAYFTSYTSNGFDVAMQTRLAEVCAELDTMGVHFMASNSHTTLILDLYRRFNVHVVEASRAINSKGNRRGKVKEVVVVNY